MRVVHNIGIVAASGLFRSPWSSPLASHLRGAGAGPGAGAAAGVRRCQHCCLNHHNVNVPRRSPPPLLSIRPHGPQLRTSSAKTMAATSTATATTTACTFRFSALAAAVAPVDADTNPNDEIHDSAPATATTTTTTLLVGSQQDSASRAMMVALLSRGNWVETTPGVEPNGELNGKAWNHALSRTSLWSVEGSLLGLDDADLRWASAGPVGGLEEAQTRYQRQGGEGGGPGPGPGPGRPKRPGRVGRDFPSDVVFLSKHVAKSGVPALCVHPIGVPNVRARGRGRDKGLTGGRGGGGVLGVRSYVWMF